MKQSGKALKLLQEVKSISSELPPGKRNKIVNRCDKIAVIIKKNGSTRNNNHH